MENSERTLKALRNNIERTEKSGSKQYFSVFIKLNEDDRNEIPLVEHASGLEIFDEIIKDAKENSPDLIIINITSKKTEPRRKSKDFSIKLNNHEEKTENTQEFIRDTIEEQLSKFKDGLSGTGEEVPSGLGLLEERFTHQGEILQLKTEKKIRDIEHNKEIEDLRRELAQKDEEITTVKLDLQDAEKDFDTLEAQFIEYKKNKFSGISEQLSQVGTNALAGLAAKFMPLLSPAGVAGLPGEGKPSQESATVIEDANEVNILTEQIREMLNDFTEEEFKQFYNLILLIVQDKKTLDIVMKFLKQNNRGDSQ